VKVIVAGSRHETDLAVVVAAIRESGFEVTEVVSGCAPGVDTLGEKWAEERGIHVKRFPAEWRRYKRAAGPIRNGQMADYGDALVAVRYPDSRGTSDMIGKMRKAQKPFYVKEMP
jgi:hypothetical protein